MLPTVTPAQMGELFGFFGLSWVTISPATLLLFGIMFGSFILIRVKDRILGEEDDTLLDRFRNRHITIARRGRRK